jgi:hypothetical protein
VRTWISWSDFVVRTHLEKLVDLEYVLVHRGGRGQSFVYELLYGGEGADGKPFALGLIDPESLTGLESRAVDSRAVEPENRAYVEKCEPPGQKFEHEKGRFEVGSSIHSAPIEAGSCAPQSDESPGPAGSECTSHAEGVEIAPGETPSGASYRTSAPSYAEASPAAPLPSLAAGSNNAQGKASPAQEVNHVI